ncbi:hypothetical protein ISS03_04935, partial [Patescibacteria group bacterium]|nr:hypothetical protein [Patescibacteria group bacterium]
AEAPPEQMFLEQASFTNSTATLPQWQNITIPEGVENISKVYLRLGSSGTTATLGLSSTYDGVFIDSRDISVNTGYYNNFSWYLFDFSNSPISVNEGQVYYLRLSYSGSTMKFQFSVINPYPDGRLQLGSANDFMMRLYWQPPEEQPVIELATLVVETIKENTIGIISANILQVITLGLVIVCIMLIVKLLKKFS